MQILDDVSIKGVIQTILANSKVVLTDSTGKLTTGLVIDANISSAASWNSKQAGSSILTSIATLSAGTGLLKLTNGVASLDNSYALASSLGNYLPTAATSIHAGNYFTSSYPTLAIGDGQYGFSALGSELNIYSANGNVNIRARINGADAVYVGQVATREWANSQYLLPSSLDYVRSYSNNGFNPILPTANWAYKKIGTISPGSGWNMGSVKLSVYPSYDNLKGSAEYIASYTLQDGNANLYLICNNASGSIAVDSVFFIKTSSTQNANVFEIWYRAWTQQMEVGYNYCDRVGSFTIAPSETMTATAPSGTFVYANLASNAYVDLTSTQTITGQKTFNGSVFLTGSNAAFNTVNGNFASVGSLGSYFSDVAVNDTILRGGTGTTLRLGINTGGASTVQITGNSVAMSVRPTWAGYTPWDSNNLVGTRNEHNHSGVYLPIAGKASDSELLDGIDSTRFVFGDNGTASRNITDFNAVVKSGFGSGQTATGTPGTGWYHIITNKYAGDTTGWLFQIAAGFGMTAGPATPEGYYVRIKEGTSAPGTWRKLWHDGNLTGDQTAHSHSWGNITGKSTTIANFVDGAWAGGTPYYGWSFTGANTRFGFSATSGVVDVYADGNFYATDSSHLVWHAGNLVGTQNGHNHSGVYQPAGSYAASAHNHDISAITGRTVFVGNIGSRIDSGWYEYQPTTKANGWPEDSSWWHLMSSTHSNGSNYFALQIASNFYDQDFRIRSTNGNGLTAWSKIWTSTNFAQSDITNWQNGLGRISSLETRMNGVDNTWSNYLPLAGGTISGSIKGTSRSGDGGAYLFAPGTGTSSGISNGTNSPVISRYVYSGFTGFVAHNEEFYGMCNDHCSFGGGAELSIVAGTESGHISFFAGKPVLNGNGSYEAPRVGNWTNAGLSITGTLSVSGAITGSNLNVSNWNTAYEWGNHASAGYVTLSDSQTITGIKTFNADVNISTNRGLYIQGNSVAHFGGATWVDTIYSIRNNGKTLLSNDVSIISGTSGWGEGLRIVGGLANWSGIRFTTVNDSTARNGNWAVGYCADSSGNLVFSGYDGTAQKNVFRFYQSGGASLDGDFNATGAITGSNLNISNWNTAYTNSHTHSNKANLDTINQNLGTTSTALFAALNVNGKIIASEVSADINWTNIIYTPTTIAGYGITDAVNSSDSRLHSHSNIGTLNGIDQGLSTTDTVRFHVLYTTQGILAGSTIAAWRDETNYVAVGTGNITATGTVYAAELNTPWNINTNYNFYGKKAYNTSSWGSTGGLATNGIDTWLGATNSVNVFVGGVTNVLTANSGQITLGVKTYCNQFCSNTSFAGTGLFAGTGDGASLTTYNHKLTSWYGTGIYDACNGVNRGYIDHRTGSMYLNGNISAGGNISCTGTLSAGSISGAVSMNNTVFSSGLAFGYIGHISTIAGAVSQVYLGGSSTSFGVGYVCNKHTAAVNLTYASVGTNIRKWSDGTTQSTISLPAMRTAMCVWSGYDIWVMI